VTKGRRPSHVHPRVAVLLGVKAHWNVPLLICRAFSTAPALWWGLRCALTFLGELLLSDGIASIGEVWSVEKRFRVTEVFLAILWVCEISGRANADPWIEDSWLILRADSALRRRISPISLPIV